MKISKIFAGMSALAVAASAMSITASASTNSTYMYTVQASWNADAPADKEKTPVKFMYDDNGEQVLKKGATDLNNWDSGGTKFNGQWAQFILTDDNIDAITVKATIVADEATTWEYHPYDDSKTEDENSYIVFNMFGSPNTITEKADMKVINEQIEGANADAAENSFYNATGKWEVEYSGADIKKAVDDGGAQMTENGDGTYTFGWNIQVGHMKNAKVTLEVTSTENNIYDGATDDSGDGTTDDGTTDGGDSTADDGSTDGDSTTDDGNTDSDGDGVADSEDDSDGDGVVDSEDDDADGDGETDEDSDSESGSSNGGSSKSGSSNSGSTGSGSSNSGSSNGGSSSGSTSGGSSNGGSSNGSGSGTANGTDNSSTGAETMALAGLALAGAAFVVSKKK